MDYYQKYLKYKSKYFKKLKIINEQHGALSRQSSVVSSVSSNESDDEGSIASRLTTGNETLASDDTRYASQYFEYGDDVSEDSLKQQNQNDLAAIFYARSSDGKGIEKAKKLIIEGKSSVNGRYREFPFTFNALVEKEDEDMVRFLIKHRVTINKQYWYDHCLVVNDYISIYKNNVSLELIKLFLDNGFNIREVSGSLDYDNLDYFSGGNFSNFVNFYITDITKKSIINRYIEDWNRQFYNTKIKKKLWDFVSECQKNFFRLGDPINSLEFSNIVKLLSDEFNYSNEDRFNGFLLFYLLLGSSLDFENRYLIKILDENPWMVRYQRKSDKINLIMFLASEDKVFNKELFDYLIMRIKEPVNVERLPRITIASLFNEEN